MNLSQTFDVVIAGGGNAALCAAIAAARAGRSVIVVEGAPEFYRGDNTRHTRNVRVAQDGSAPTMTGVYDPDEFYDDLTRVEQRQQELGIVGFELLKIVDLAHLVADDHAQIPQRME